MSSSLRLRLTSAHQACKRHSHEATLRRRAIYGEGMYASQLGASHFALRISPTYLAVLEAWNVAPCCWQAPFHGPFWPTCSLPTVLPDATPLSSWVPELEIVEFRGAGRIWHAFTVRFGWFRSSDADIVAKIANMSGFPQLALGSEGFGRDDARAGIVNELTMYSEPLSQLQGSVVPRFHGLLGSAQPDGTQQWCALFDDAGTELAHAERLDQSLR